MKSKYGNKKTTIDGIEFDSILEARRYSFLKMMEKAGKLSGLQLQVKHELIPAFVHNGKKYRPMFYISDFEYMANGRLKIEDAKGVRTAEYKAKIKIFLHNKDFFDFYEITSANDLGGIE